MNNIIEINGTPPPADAIYQRLFNFIENVLLDFMVLSRDKDGNLVTSEDAITEDLADYLDNKQESLQNDPNIAFKFTNQSQQKTDIGVKFGRGYYTYNRNPFCWIEAKRLPTPKGGKNRDEREYVFVDKDRYSGNGGIQRFKDCKHAPKLPYSIMLGYIQDGNSVDFWFLKINQWIVELARINNLWDNKDCLSRCSTGEIDLFKSIHKRIDGSKIELQHFWIRL